jgi:hypothetical protein
LFPDEEHALRYIVFVICSLIGFVIGHYLLAGATAAYLSSIVSYHLYLGFLVATAKKKAGFSMPVWQTIVTHLAFLSAVIGLPYLRDQIPFFRIVSIFIPALAPFEAGWLFSKERENRWDEAPQQSKLDPPAEQLLNDATPEDHESFLKYMQQSNRKFRKPGLAIRDEFALWLADRARKKPTPVGGGATEG